LIVFIEPKAVYEKAESVDQEQQVSSSGKKSDHLVLGDSTEHELGISVCMMKKQPP